MRKIAFTVLVIILFVSCSISPKPINYGSDGCHFCSMTIVDKQHAAQYVTEKGKAFKFDATECMMNELKKVDNSTIALFLVNDFNNPGELVDATLATYLISENIPSPMGAFLSAFERVEEAERAHEANKGELITWAELQSKFK